MDLVAATAALGMSIGLSLLLRSQPNVGSGPHVISALGYLAYWVPLLAAVLVVKRRGWGGSRTISWRFKPMDILWGLGVGLLLRTLVTFLEFVVRGDVSVGTVLTQPAASPVELVLFAFSLFVVPIVVAPLVEELFFRSTLLRALERDPAAIGNAVLAVTGSAVLFALPHALQATSFASGGVAFGSTAIFGIGAGVLAVTTRRLWSPVTAHAAYNGAILPLMLV